MAYGEARRPAPTIDCVMAFGPASHSTFRELTGWLTGCHLGSVRALTAVPSGNRATRGPRPTLQIGARLLPNRVGKAIDPPILISHPTKSKCLPTAGSLRSVTSVLSSLRRGNHDECHTFLRKMCVTTPLTEPPVSHIGEHNSEHHRHLLSGQRRAVPILKTRVLAAAAQLLEMAYVATTHITPLTVESSN
jgi:hypothetical protein